MLFNHVGQTIATFHTKRLNMSSLKQSQQRNVAGKLLLLRTREYNRVQQSCMGWPNEYNIIQHCGKQQKCCIVQHLFGEKFDHNQTSCNKIQHDKTRYNKVAKRVQHFIKHQSCMMLYEMLYSFGRGFILSSVGSVTCVQASVTQKGDYLMFDDSHYLKTREETVSTFY